MIPSRIRIKGSVFYDVVYQELVDGNPNLDGLCVRIESDNVPISRQIILRKRLSKSQRERALIHEILHAIQFEYGIAIPHSLIYLLEVPLHRLLKLNKWL